MNIPASFHGQQHALYTKSYSLDPGVANNGFSFQRKPDRPPLKVTPLQLGSVDELTVGQHTAFQDFDEDQWMECRGLEAAVLDLCYPIPVYVFDNHNHAFYCWVEAFHQGWFQNGAALIHMDAHYDDSHPEHSSVDIDNLEDVFRYTNEVLQIASFIKPALELGLFSEVINYVESLEFSKLHDLDDRQVVINLDLDVFCEEMSHVSYREKLRVLEHYLPKSTLITMSTSPFFIPQEKAIEMAKRVLRDLFA